MSTDTERQLAFLKVQRQLILTRAANQAEDEPVPAVKVKPGFMIYRSTRSTANDGYLDGAARKVGNVAGSAFGWVLLFLLFIAALEIVHAVVTTF